MRLEGASNGMDAAKRALAALEDLEPRDQLTGMGWAVVAVLGALRERFAQAAEERDAFGALCSETQAWIRREIEALRFAKAH